VLQITIKTRGGKWDGSVCRALMEICDSRGNCCHTSPEGKGLYNPGKKNRQINQTDVYKSTKILGNCAEEGTLLSDPITAKITVTEPGGNDGWGVEWIEITMSNGRIFSCPINGWLSKKQSQTGETSTPMLRSKTL